MSKANGLPVAWLKEKGIKVAEGDMLGSDRYEEKPMTKEALKLVNDTSDHDDAYITAFAYRENTGKQPVGGNVRIDATFDYGCAYDVPADYLDWSIYFGDPSLKTWKLNHKSLLAKFKEQGANTVRQYDDQEVELATHYSGNNNTFHRKCNSINRKSMVLNDAGRWIYSDCTTNAELDSDDYWKLDGKQIIKPVTVPEFPSDFYQKGGEVANTDLHTPKPLKAGDVIEVADYCFIPWELLTANEPEIEMLIGGGKNVNEVYKAGRFAYHGAKYSIFVTEDGKEYSRKNSKIKTRPIDNRSDKEKLKSALMDSIVWNSTWENNVDELMASDKFTITLKD